MESEVKTNVGMGCYEHSDRTVVATCPKCGKFMCKECAEKYESKLCESCEQERVSNITKDNKQKSKKYFEASKKQLKGVIIKSIILAVIGFCLGEGEGIGLAIGMAYLFASFPWGWNVIKKIIDDGALTWFWLSSDTLFLVTLLIKFALAVIIGVVAFPIGIISAVKEFNTAKVINENINKEGNQNNEK